MKEEKEVDTVKRLLNLIYTKELIWVALTLTCFIGLIELLPEIKRYGTSASEISLTFLVTFIGLLLIGGTIFSFSRFTTWLDIENKWQMNFSLTLRRIGPDHKIGLLHKIFVKTDKDGNILHFRKWVVPLTSFIFAAIWIAMIVLKII